MSNGGDGAKVPDEVKAMAEALAQKMVEEGIKKMEEDYKNKREEQDNEFQKKMSELMGAGQETSIGGCSSNNKDSDNNRDNNSTKTWFHTYSYDYNNISRFPNVHFKSLNVGKAHRFDEICYTY